MATDRKPLQNFNLNTMSGIYPGSRTKVYQRLLLHTKQDAGSQWYQLQWYTDPSAAVLFQLQTNKPAMEEVLSLAEPYDAAFVQRFDAELKVTGLEADACFACRHWQPLNVQTDDGLPAGRCCWSDVEAALPDALATQSALSMACEHFQRRTEPLKNPATTSSPRTSHPRVLKSAELDPDRLPFWPRLWHRLLPSSKPVQDWADQLVERSGVGAGTEPCFICQGRLADLGALAVSSPEGDKQTLSIWRCRSCYTLFFNDWTDRWERLESLETEERYYRIAPAEAFAALQIIHTTVGGDHPRRRQDRQQQRTNMLALLTGKEPLSHQIRQGR